MPDQQLPPWDSFARRILVRTANYLDFDGNYSAGGRQRHIRDLCNVIRDWGRDVVVVQKATRPFETTCPAGFPVIGLQAPLSARGDIRFAYLAKRVAGAGDVWLYASGEDPWPFFSTNSKAIQHGVWWDGPQNLFVRRIQAHRAIAMVERVKSVLCVDTNFINWLRCQGPRAYALCQKCVYFPNYADIERISVSSRISDPLLRIIVARRNEHKRGIHVAVDAFSCLKGRGVPFCAHICTTSGIDYIRARLDKLDLSIDIHVSQEDMESVLSAYQSCNVALVPTLWSEGTSLACVEALCAGLPVVATPVGGLGNLIIPGFNGLLAPPTAEGLAGALEALSDIDRRMAMSANCLSLRTPLSVASWARRVEEWLRS